jgi:glycosyltransferase involved in cell wall biosynthesis
MINWNHGSKDTGNSKFSIIIPSWNNLSFLKICTESVIKNSKFIHQIIIHVNEGNDGTLEWVRDSGFDYTHSAGNVGVCWAMNAARALVKTDYIVYLNDDMYLLPGWDQALWDEIVQSPDKFFFFSATTIEPRKSYHPGVLSEFDYGVSPETFREKELLNDYKTIKGQDWSGATWPPNIVHKDVWDLVGGYSIEYFPGLYSDPDFSMKLYEAGVRHFKGIDASRAYHFGSRSTRRIKMNMGNKQFLNKWGITSVSFTRIILRRGLPYKGRIKSKEGDFIFKLAYLKSGLKRIGWAVTGTGKTKGKYSFNQKK